MQEEIYEFEDMIKKISELKSIIRELELKNAELESMNDLLTSQKEGYQKALSGLRLFYISEYLSNK